MNVGGFDAGLRSCLSAGALKEPSHGLADNTAWPRLGKPPFSPFKSKNWTDGRSKITQKIIFTNQTLQVKAYVLNPHLRKNEVDHMITEGAKIRAARAILGLSRQALAIACHISPSLLQKIEDDEKSFRSDIKLSVFNHLEQKGFEFTNNSIIFNQYNDKMDTKVMPENLSNEQILEKINCDTEFKKNYQLWSDDIKDAFLNVIRSFNKFGLDIWYVDMNGEMRIGSKGESDEKGRPFAFIRFKKQGFTLDWHRKIASYVDYIRQMPEAFGHGALVGLEFAEKLSALPDDGIIIPPLIKNTSKSRFPVDYI